MASTLAPQPDDPAERVVLLVTDGKPNCPVAGPEKHSDDLPATLTALDDLSAIGVKTFVIGYLTKDFATVMDQMAMHGGTSKHYPVEDEKTFQNAFGQIAGNLAPCAYELEKDAPGAEFVRVLLDGTELPLGAGGFTLEGKRTIKLNDASCQKLRDGNDHGVKVLVECEPVRVL